jgi:hypothetical protein
MKRVLGTQSLNRLPCYVRNRMRSRPSDDLTRRSLRQTIAGREWTGEVVPLVDNNLN